MGLTTNIPWCEATWNPWYGCEPISPACDNCYARAEMKRYGINPDVLHQSKTTLTNPLKWNRNGNLPVGSRIFTCSWSDFFLDAADPWRAEAWEIIRQVPEYIFMILTKRPERIHKALPANWGSGWKNVWLGVTAETQELLDSRMFCFDTVHGNKFVSLEPLLGPVSVANWSDKIRWVIAGGENGPHARPTHQDWIRDLAISCRIHSLPFYFKGWGRWLPTDQAMEKIPDAWLAADPVMRCGPAGFAGIKPYPGQWFNAGNNSGDLLDGKIYHENPKIQ